ncbi:RecA-family ATPase-like protein [Methylobacterium sp. 4-46]|uniref:AAA family ATPase n=1 Tax=unclassified Methylobacterium TaxID=2615210 RepID=UPI000165C949|nr:MULTISPECIES: AAA family ATPase [Methylobacterium]ACA15749.1 RecA-family ATPase-like protein [Methylobacterium sp. 4-46]WFT81482.1 AAA family ATPase [Methylobacterium nodulans]
MSRPSSDESYAQAALDRECEGLAATRSGRNNQLNLAAFNIGQLVGAGKLDRNSAERCLFEAATANGYVQKDGAAAARATIRSGLSKGELEPRTTPAPAGPRPNGHANGAVAPAARHGSAGPFPDWTPPDAKSKPHFFAIGRDAIDPLRDELRRHIYRREGSPVRIKVKLTSGEFRDFYRVRRPSDGEVGWQGRKPAGYQPVPYTGPAGALDPFDPEHRAEPLLWPEGERDVDTLAAVGLLAFTFGGSNDVPDAARALVAGRDLVVLADNDEPGRACEERKIALASGAAARLQLIRFPEIGVGEDVTDWLNGYGGTAAALLDRAEPAPQPLPWARTAEASPAPLRATPFRWRDPASIPPREWLYGRHLIRKFTSATFALGGLGKSSLVIVEALAMATGRPLLGIKPAGRLRVWLWNGEDPLEELERRVLAACLHYSISEVDLDGWLFLDSGRDSGIILATTSKTGTTVAAPAFDQLEATIRENRIDVVILDPFVSTHAVSENDNSAIDLIAQGINRVAGRTNCAFELVHHVRKGQAGGAEYTVEDGRGASALKDKTRAARVLNAMSKDEVERAGVEESWRYFKVTTGKANLAPRDEKATWYRTASVDLGNATQERPSDHIGVVTAWEWPDAFNGVNVDDLRRAQAAVAKGQWRADVQAKNWVGHPIAEALGLNPDDKRDRDRIKALLRTWIRMRMFVVVQGRDEKSKPRPFIEVGEAASD